jgi:predicted amidohydrolase YtcJ
MTTVLYTNAKFVGGYDWMLVGGCKIISLGSLADPPPDAQQTVDLGHRFVLPGLHDAHIHVYELGRLASTVDLQGASSIADLQRRLRDFCLLNPSAEFIEGNGWDQDLLGRLPTASDIDDVEEVNMRPVVLNRRCWHVCVANKAALAICGVNQTTPDPTGGAIDRLSTGQIPSGVFREVAMELLFPVTRKPQTLEQQLAFLESGLRICVENGITSVQTNDGPEIGAIDDAWGGYCRLLEQNKLPIRVLLTVPFSQLGTEFAPAPGSARYANSSADRDDAGKGGGTKGSHTDAPMLSCDRVKIFSDGGLGASTAALLAPYSDAPPVAPPVDSCGENGETQQRNRGIMQHTPAELQRQVAEAHAAGYRVEVHAIGDRAATHVIEAFEAARLVPTDIPVLTHCQILNRDLVERMSRMGVVADVQPQFVPSDATQVLSRLGPVAGAGAAGAGAAESAGGAAGAASGAGDNHMERLRYSYAWSTLSSAGVVVAGGSDAPVEKPAPLIGMHCAVTRKVAAGWGFSLRADENGGVSGGGGSGSSGGDGDSGGGGNFSALKLSKGGDIMQPEECMSVEAALRLYTTNAAYAGGQLPSADLSNGSIRSASGASAAAGPAFKIGRLEAGWEADFVVLDRDVMDAAQPDALLDAMVCEVYVGGERAFRRGEEEGDGRKEKDIEGAQGEHARPNKRTKRAGSAAGSLRGKNGLMSPYCRYACRCCTVMPRGAQGAHAALNAIIDKQVVL